MRTRRSRGLKQTRKGGKDTKDNRSNWENYWKKSGYPEYKPQMNYPGIKKKYFGDDKRKYPSKYVKFNTPNTYIIQRHGFSCANLSKVKGNPIHGRIADPSLTAYGIYSLLRNKPMPEGFDGIVFVSSLVRTWQTAILEYGQFGPLTIVVSPYIKEKHGWLGDLSNMPLPFDQQMSKMEEFMQFLKGIDHATQIVKQHIIVYNGIRYPLGSYPTQEPPIKDVYIEHLKNREFLTAKVSTSRSWKMKAIVPAIQVIPEPSYREYYGAEGFVFFDHWVSEHYPRLRTIFVVSHSHWMQKIIKQYFGQVETEIFDENAWKLTIRPLNFLEEANFEFVITPGVPKPSRESTGVMNVSQEPTCQAPQTRPLPDPLEYAEQFSERDSEESESPENQDPSQESAVRNLMESHEPIIPSGLDQPNPLAERTSDDIRPRLESLSSQDDPQRPRLNTEATPDVSKVKTVSVTNQKTHVITRSYTELVHMLCDRSLSTGLNALMASTIDFKTKVMDYIKSNPYVMVSDPTDTSYLYKRKIPIYLFENHYLIFILLCKPYFDLFINSLEINDDELTKTILSFFNITVPMPVMVTFLKELQQLMDDPDVYHLLLSTCSRNANKHYAFKEGDFLLSQTLLDLLLYELDVFKVTPVTIEFMYTCMIDLMRYGARCSAIHYRMIRPKTLVEMATGFELPSKAIVPFEMPIVQIELLPKENEIFQTWEKEKRGIDPNGILYNYQRRYTDIKRKLKIEERKVQVLYNKEKNQIAKLSQIHEDFLRKNSALFHALEQIKTEYRAAKAGIDPTNVLLIARKKMHHAFDKDMASYLNQAVVEHLSGDPIVTRIHNAFFQKIMQPELSETHVSLGGLRGTSWKKTLLRQSSVKAGRYRASLYKGKRRTRANRK